MSLFLTFEGLDGSGKSTQVRLLQDAFLAEGKDVRVLREPGGTPIGESIRSILLDPSNRDLSDAAELFLFSASRSQLVETLIKPMLSSGTTIICDRFYDSTTAYQGGGRGLDEDVIAAVNRAASGGLVPDATFFLDVPPSILADRIKKAGVSPDRLESNALAFHTKVRERYLDLSRAESRFHVLDGTRSPEDIAGEIRLLCDTLEGTRHA